jgi:hypothetical protein
MTQRQPIRESDLAQFTGSEHWYRHGLTGTLYTDGAKFVAETAGAYWLLDEIAIPQRFDKRLGREEFQVWTLTVHPERGATLTADDGNGTVIFTKAIAYTDFPPPGITLYHSGNTTYLPSEY